MIRSQSPYGAQIALLSMRRAIFISHHSKIHVYIVKAVEELTGIELQAHDLRRTLIPEALATGTPIQTVQAIAGHSRGKTTLRYAQVVDARKARKERKLRYG